MSGEPEAASPYGKIATVLAVLAGFMALYLAGAWAVYYATGGL